MEKHEAIGLIAGRLACEQLKLPSSPSVAFECIVGRPITVQEYIEMAYRCYTYTFAIRRSVDICEGKDTRKLDEERGELIQGINSLSASDYGTPDEAADAVNVIIRATNAKYHPQKPRENDIFKIFPKGSPVADVLRVILGLPPEKG